MNRSIGAMCITLAAGAGFATAALLGAHSDNPPSGTASVPTPPATSPTPSQIFDALVKHSAPGKEHEVLKALAGEWDLAGRYDFGGGVVVDFSGRSTVAPIIGGRFMQFDSVTGADGKPQAETRLVLGYDTRRARYTLWGVDSFGSFAVNAEGGYDAELRKLVFTGEVGEGDRRTRFRQEFRIAGADTLIQELHVELTPTNWTQMAQLKYTRTKR